MGKISRAAGICYLLFSLVALYALVQTTSNYTKALETNMRFRIEITRDPEILSPNGTPSVLLTFFISNPSQLEARIIYTDFTIYLYNKTNEEKPYQPITSYGSYKQINVQPGQKINHTINQDATPKKSHIQFIYDRDPKARIDYNIRFRYMLPEFPDWPEKEIRFVTYVEASQYG